MNNLFPPLLAFACFALLYHFGIRRVLLDCVRFKIFALRDELRSKAIHHEVKGESFQFCHLERALCNLVALTPHLNLYRFGQFVIWRRELKVPSRERRFRAVATPALQNLEQKAVKALFWVLLINSPAGAFVLLWALAAAAIAAMINEKRKEWIETVRTHLENKGREFLEQELVLAEPRLVGAAA
jgi:hypothetical protein